MARVVELYDRTEGSPWIKYVLIYFYIFGNFNTEGNIFLEEVLHKEDRMNTRLFLLSKLMMMNQTMIHFCEARLATWWV